MPTDLQRLNAGRKTAQSAQRKAFFPPFSFESQRRH
jgi:hypothetical protein